MIIKYPIRVYDNDLDQLFFTSSRYKHTCIYCIGFLTNRGEFCLTDDFGYIGNYPHGPLSPPQKSPNYPIQSFFGWNDGILIGAPVNPAG